MVPMSKRLEQPSSMCLFVKKDIVSINKVKGWGPSKGSGLPSQSILPGKQTAAIVALVAALLQVHALVMSLEIGLAHKLLGATGFLAGEGIVPVGLVRLQVRLVVVASAEQLPTSLDLALKVGFLLCRQAPLLPLGTGNSVRSFSVLEESRCLRGSGARIELGLEGLVVGLLPSR